MVTPMSSPPAEVHPPAAAEPDAAPDADAAADPEPAAALAADVAAVVAAAASDVLELDPRSAEHPASVSASAAPTAAAVSTFVRIMKIALLWSCRRLLRNPEPAGDEPVAVESPTGASRGVGRRSPIAGTPQRKFGHRQVSSRP